VNPAGPIFDLKKLDWLNGVYIRLLALPDLTHRLIPHLLADKAFGVGVDTEDALTQIHRSRLAAVTELIQTRIALLGEAAGYVRPFFVGTDDLVIADDAKAQLADTAAEVLAAASSALGEVQDWSTENIETAIRRSLIDGLQLKPKVAFTPVRVATSGARISPPLFESLHILGKDETLARLSRLAGEL